MRTDTAGRGTGGLARYSEERALLPRLGFFIGNENLYPASDKVTLHEPVDYTRLTAATQDGAIRWMSTAK